MKKTLLKLFLLVSAFMCGLGAWADDETTSYTITGTEGTDYTVDGTSGDITILKSGVTVSGQLSGNLIIQNSANGSSFYVNFKNVKTLSTDSHWNSSIIIRNTGDEWPHFYFTFSGTNAFVNSTTSGFIINDVTGGKPCYVYLQTEGQSVFYFGANSSDSNVKALSASDNSHIRFSVAAKADCAQYYDATISKDQTPTWVNMSFGKQEETTAFESYFTSHKFIKFTMNPTKDTRKTSAGWITACYPYYENVTNGEVYEVYGKVLYTADDIDVSGTAARYQAGDLKHLILQRRNDANKNKVDAGKPYFVRRIDGSNDIIFEIPDTASTYVGTPKKVKGFEGTFETQITMATGSFFLNGTQMLRVSDKYECYLDCNRAYFKNLDDIDEYVIVPESSTNGYYVYRRSTATGGTEGPVTTPDESSSTDSSNNDESKVKINTNGIILLGEDETTAIMNLMNSNKVASSQYYDLQGRKVQIPKKGGLYIVNGKKVLY